MAELIEPFRLRLLKAITTTLEGVTPANGYRFDLGPFTDQHGRPARRVFRGREEFGASDPLPMVAILEDPRVTDVREPDQGYTESMAPYRLYIQGFIEDDPEHPTDPAHRLVADVIVALAKQKARRRDMFGLGYKKPCVHDMTIGQPIVRPPDDDNSSVAFFFLPLTLTTVEDLENPFS